MHLHEATRAANALCDWLRPHCDPKLGNRITVAGSIRRQRPHVNDIDLVCIPTVADTRDLMGEVISRHYPILDFLSDYIRARNPVHSKLDSLPHFITHFGRVDNLTIFKTLPPELSHNLLFLRGQREGLARDLIACADLAEKWLNQIATWSECAHSAFQSFKNTLCHDRFGSPYDLERLEIFFLISQRIARIERQICNVPIYAQDSLATA